MTWKPLGDPKQIGPGTRQYLETKHGHEGGHDVALAGLTVRVLPDGHTTPRQRSQAISEALQTIAAVMGRCHECQEVPNQRLDGFDPVAYLVGVLITEGVRSIEVDGVPIFETPEPRGEWKVELRDDGSVHAAFLGGAA